MLGKRLINSNTAAAGGSCTTDTLQILGDTSCKAYYKMSDATDESGNYDGTPTSVNFNVAGKFGNAGEFNGSSSKIDIASIITGNNSFSVSFWLNPTANSITPFMMGSAATGQAFLTFITGNTLNFGRGGDSLGSTTANTIPNNTWTHIAVSSNAGSVTVYVNGVSNLTFSTTYNISSGGTFIGYASGYGQYFEGKIDQIRIFNKSLSSSEVTTIYNEVQCLPTIVPTDNFTPITYTGNGGTQSTNSLSNQSGTINFAPDLVWIKERGGSEWHNLFDSVRGSNKNLYSNETSSEATSSNKLTSFDTNGFSLGADNNVNKASSTFVAWNWKAGGADVQNTDGTITSQVSANTDAGFSIVKHTGTGVVGTVGHGLDSAIELIIYKQTSSSSVGKNWIVYASPLGNTGGLILNLTSTKFTDTDAWNNTTPTSTVFTLGAGDDGYGTQTNVSGKENIAYCFHSVEGMSRVGSYVGTAATDNPILTGFRPAFVMVKGTSNGGSWIIYDNKRNTSNPRNTVLYADSSTTESTNTNLNIDFNSNGFVLTGADTDFNGLNRTYIYLAIAEEVFNPSGLTRNATNPFGDASELALYKFEDNADDAEGSYNGTFNNPSYATGYIDKAAAFNGSSSYVLLGTNTFNSLTSFSFSCWVNLNNALTGYEYLFDGWDYQNSSKGLAVRITPNGNIQANTGFSNSVTTITSSGTITHSVWTHIVATFSQSHTTISINGNIESPQSNGGFNFFTGTKYNLGAFTYTNSIYEYFLDGKLDQVRIFNRALDSGEIIQLYNE